MIVLGIDSGSTWLGWSRVRATHALQRVCTAAGRPYQSRGSLVIDYIASGKAPAQLDAVVKLVAGVDLVAIEGVGGRLFPRDGRGPALVAQLLATSHVAGGIEWLVRYLGVECVMQPAAWWRSIVIGSKAPSDREISHVIPRLVRGWPTRSNAHERDGAGMAIASVWTRKGGARAAQKGPAS